MLLSRPLLVIRATLKMNPVDSQNVRRVWGSESLKEKATLGKTEFLYFKIDFGSCLLSHELWSGLYTVPADALLNNIERGLRVGGPQWITLV